MPPEHGRGEALLADRGGEGRQLAGLVGEVERRLEPAEPRGDGPLDDVLV